MIIDSHVHLGKLKNTKFSESYEKNLKFLIEEMAENKIDKVIILAGLVHDDFNIPTKNLLKIISDTKNINVVGGIDVFKYTNSELEELDQLIKNGKIVGMKLYPGYQHFYPHDEKCVPIYNLCLKYNIPVIFHSGDTLAGYIKNPKVKYAHPIHIDDVATDFPDLKIVIAHLGNPWLIDCSEILYKNPNVYGDISGFFVGEPDAPYADLIRKRVQELIAYVGEDKLLYGTDWPIAPMKNYIEFAKSLKLNPEGEEKLFYKNASHLFKI